MREMKDSGIEWIGEIPADWTTTRIGNFFHFSSGDSLTNEEIQDEGLYKVYGANGPRGYYHHTNLTGKHILIGRVGALCGNIHIVNEPIWVTEHALIAEQISPGVYTDFAARVFESMNLGQYSKASAQPVIASSVVQRLQIPIPPSLEQRHIAKYLDRKCSQIDAIIARQQEVIEKLKAYKLSVITEAVTKGLNPDVPMKDSGVEWIGEIPVHWDLIKATRIIISTQNGLSRRDLSKSTGKIVLKLRNISSNGEIDYEYQNRIELTGQELDTYRLSDGDILFVRVNGSKSLVGKCAIFHSIGEDVAYNDHIIRVRISEKCIKKFLFWYLLSICGKMEIDLHTSTSAGQYTISGEELRDIRFILPPKIEQLEIDRYLSKMSRCIDKIIHQKQISIDELSAYKKSLIFEVVTGKREV